MNLIVSLDKKERKRRTKQLSSVVQEMLVRNHNVDVEDECFGYIVAPRDVLLLAIAVNQCHEESRVGGV